MIAPAQPAAPPRPRRVCVVTGSRAEYGLLRWLMQAIKEDPALSLQVIATGMHLSPEFGLTFQEIERDGFVLDCKVEMLASSDTPVGIATSMGLGSIRFADAIHRLQPDLVLVLGDRFELLSVAAAALVARVPIAHLHGGETTEGAIDEAIRHSITKMSHLHFVAAREYEKRVIQLGEHPDSVFLVGGLGVDNIKRAQLLDRAGVEASLNIKLRGRNLLITFHPVTLEKATAGDQMAELLAALEALTDTGLIFTMPNADTDGRVLIKMIDQFVSRHSNAQAHTSLGQLRYFSTIAQVDGVIGNSSSGLLEVPTFKKGTINIGDRQRGRLQASSVINCEPDRGSIYAAMERLYSPGFQADLNSAQNPYGNGGAIGKIIETIKSTPLNDLLKKRFYDLARH